MQIHSTKPSPKQARAAAQIAYVKGIDALRTSGGLTEADRRFLYSQRPTGIDEEGRIVLEFASAADAAAAGSSPALNRIARKLRGDHLAAGLDRKVALPPRGNGNGASTRAREQLRRLCLTSFSYHDKSRDCGRNIVLADKWVTWSGQGVQVTLGELFYTIARSGSVPLDAGILDGLGRSPLALDAYAWLTYRVARLERETVVPWRSLEIQFGAEYKHPRQFRWKFCRSLEAIKGLWSGIEAESREKGLLLRPCAPSVLSWLERSSARDAFLR